MSGPESMRGRVTRVRRWARPAQRFGMMTGLPWVVLAAGFVVATISDMRREARIRREIRKAPERSRRRLVRGSGG